MYETIEEVLTVSKEKKIIRRDGNWVNDAERSKTILKQTKKV